MPSTKSILKKMSAIIDTFLRNTIDPYFEFPSKYSKLTLIKPDPLS